MIQDYTINDEQALCDVIRGGEPTRAIGINWIGGDNDDGAHVSTLLAIAQDRIAAIAALLAEDDPALALLLAAQSSISDSIQHLADSGVNGG